MRQRSTKCTSTVTPKQLRRRPNHRRALHLARQGAHQAQAKPLSLLCVEEEEKAHSLTVCDLYELFITFGINAGLGFNTALFRSPLMARQSGLVKRAHKSLMRLAVVKASNSAVVTFAQSKLPVTQAQKLGYACTW